MTPFHHPHPLPTGRWAVVHRVPGTETLHVDAECLTERAAQHVAYVLNRQRGLPTETQPTPCTTPTAA